MARLPTTRTSMLDEVSRLADTHVSPSRQVDADQPGNGLELTVLMSGVVKELATTNVRLVLQISPDDSVWRDLGVIEYRGHLGASGEDNPGMQVGPMAVFRGRFIRAQLEVRNIATVAGVQVRGL